MPGADRSLRSIRAIHEKILAEVIFAGGGPSVPTARAKREEHVIPFVFVVSGGELHTTFTYDETADRWNWTIDDVKDGKADRFADLTLNRRR